jgi:serine/threonine protein kinase
MISQLIDTDIFPVLNFDFETHWINDQFGIVELHDVKYFLKQETTEKVLHEFYVGLQLNKLKSRIPIFAAMITAYSCTPAVGKYRGCKYANNVTNFVLYQFIEGLTMKRAIIDNVVSKQEAWEIIEMLSKGLDLANKLTGFVHQDLHFDNIILRPLDGIHRIRVGNTFFNSKYLPQIIDFGRSKIFDFSPIVYPRKDRDLLLQEFVGFYYDYPEETFDDTKYPILKQNDYVPTVKYPKCPKKDTVGIEEQDIFIQKKRELLIEYLIENRLNDSVGRILDLGAEGKYEIKKYYYDDVIYYVSKDDDIRTFEKTARKSGIKNINAFIDNAIFV